MIQTNALTKTFEGFKALDEAALNVPKGCVYGLVGPNGAGKTTVIRHIAGVMRPDSGSVLVDGEPVDENNAVKERMALIPDDPYFFPGASVNDMRRFYRGVYPRFDDDLFERLREVFPLDTKRHIRRFSRGMQKQAAFWLAICCRPDVLLLDEPVDGLDPVMRRRVWSLVMQDVAERQTTVLISSHNLRELEDVCDHVGIMHRGKLIVERNLADLQGNLTKLQAAFPGDSDKPLPESDYEVLHHSAQGRLHTYILRGGQEEITRKVSAFNPLLCDLLPLSLEEIFIYELGGLDYAEILL
ncbi:MAG: ABC transporter ATP-binding protein [Oscillospiraceae bacterium]|jgi:ABC-2 type transport system ATP-binding protein|nr:ABC transporter ATP-binding protein [Oscillospiraceae bacterium]